MDVSRDYLSSIELGEGETGKKVRSQSSVNLERLLVVGEPTGMMTSHKRQKVFFLELSLRPTTDSHLCSDNGGRID